jgi:hypothetical protein
MALKSLASLTLARWRVPFSLIINPAALLEGCHINLDRRLHVRLALPKAGIWQVNYLVGDMAAALRNVLQEGVVSIGCPMLASIINFNLAVAALIGFDLLARNRIGDGTRNIYTAFAFFIP